VNGVLHLRRGSAVDFADESEVIPDGRRVFVADSGLGGTGERAHLQMEEPSGAVVDVCGHGGVSFGQHADERLAINHAPHGGAPSGW
jgi:hypothetical protein